MPVWPIWRWSRWPIPALASARQPAASTSMSWIVTPPSSIAPRAASQPRSTTSLSRYRWNFVMDVPRIQTSSAIGLSSLRRSVAEGDRFGSVVVCAGDVRRQRHRHAGLDVVRGGLDLDDVRLHLAAAVQVDDSGHERGGDAGCSPVHDREAADHAVVAETASAERTTAA